MAVRIAHCILTPRYSGAEILVLGLVRAQIAAGCAVAVIALRPSETSFKAEMDALAELGCAIFVPTEPLVRQHRFFWIRRAVRMFRPDVLFAHSLPPSVYSRLALLGLAGVSHATVLHTNDDFDDPKLRSFERWMWRRNAAVVGVSDASLRNYRALITDKQAMRLIANGVNLDSVRAAGAHRAEARSALYQAASEEIILLQVGRISTQKQQLLSIEGLASLGQELPLDKTRLVFVGILEDREYHERLLAAARSLGVAHRVQFMGSRKDVPLLLAGADAHLMPSGWEAHSIAAIEAVASGVYCIFTPIESFLSFKGMPGVDFLPQNPNAQQMAAVLANAIRSSATVRRYERDLESYGFEHCAREYLRLAESLARKERFPSSPV
jgi:glycosyltransferase involved in cell wall biosynthesis